MRTFIAIDLPDQLRQSLDKLRRCLQRSSIRVSWVKAENLHITLKFLGEIDTDLLPDLICALDRTAVNSSPFTARIQGSGFFPNRCRPRILYAATDAIELFRQLTSSLNQELTPFGFKLERNFNPHITLARIKSERNIEQLFAELDQHTLQGRFEVKGLSLYRSILHPTGVRYQQLHHSPF